MSAAAGGNEIKFYHANEKYNFFANTISGAPVKFRAFGHEYEMPNNEVLYQLSKILTLPIDNTQKQTLFNQQYDMMRGMSGSQAQQHAKEYPFNSDAIHRKSQLGDVVHTDGTELDLKERIMYETLLIKFTQHPEMLRSLLATDNVQITEDTALATYVDNYWGNGWSNNGRNAVGKLLMKARTELRAELDEGDVKVRCGLSQELCERIGIDYSTNIDPTRRIKINYLKSTSNPLMQWSESNSTRLDDAFNHIFSGDSHFPPPHHAPSYLSPTPSYPDPLTIIHGSVTANTMRDSLTHPHSDEFSTKLHNILNTIERTVQDQLSTSTVNAHIGNLSQQLMRLVQSQHASVLAIPNDPSTKPHFTVDSNGKYDVKLPDHFSGQVFIPRLNAGNQVVGHDLLSYENGNLVPQKCLINPAEPKEHCRVNQQTIDICRSKQQSHLNSVKAAEVVKGKVVKGRGI